MNIFNDNVLQIAKRNVDLAAAIKAASGGVLTIEPARSGVPSARRASRWIHSAYDPIREADTWADTHASTCQTGETIVVAGIGLLYHVEALRKKLSPDIAVALLISNLDEFRDALTARPLGSLNDAVVWLSGTPA